MLLITFFFFLMMEIFPFPIIICPFMTIEEGEVGLILVYSLYICMLLRSIIVSSYH